MKFKIGDVVQLTSKKGPIMTISAVKGAGIPTAKEAAAMDVPIDGYDPRVDRLGAYLKIRDAITCLWFDCGTLHQESFPTESLILIKE